jgi:WhiB family redox-sensing transcriptional regulator
MEALTRWLMKPGAPDVAHTPGEVLNRPDWHTAAICRGQGVTPWIRDSRLATYASQKAVCERCPGRRECLEYALGHPELVGCWGGTDELDRRKLRQLTKRTSA